jgi:hypothetical protein
MKTIAKIFYHAQMTTFETISKSDGYVDLNIFVILMKYLNQQPDDLYKSRFLFSENIAIKSDKMLEYFLPILNFPL